MVNSMRLRTSVGDSMRGKTTTQLNTLLGQLKVIVYYHVSFLNASFVSFSVPLSVVKNSESVDRGL